MPEAELASLIFPEGLMLKALLFYRKQMLQSKYCSLTTACTYSEIDVSVPNMSVASLC
jgi:hypothetical protein